MRISCNTASVFFQNFMIPKTQHAITTLVQHFGSLAIFLNPHCMLASVKLNHQTMLRTTKIDNKLTNRILTSEFHLESARTQKLPQLLFCVGLPSPESACTPTN